MSSKPILILTLIALAVPTTASANISYPGEHGVNQPEVNTMVAAGREFWSHRGVAVPQPLLLSANNLGKYSDGLTTQWTGGPRCRAFSPAYGYPEVICKDRFLYKSLAEIRNRFLDTWYRRDVFAGLCTTYWHELGHVGNLAMPVFRDGQWFDGHPEHGLMGLDMKRPADCYLLAVKVIPRVKRKAR